MSSYPVIETHDWTNLVVGGSAGNPLLFRLYEDSIVSNGSFEDLISNWDGGVQKAMGDMAQHGSYVLAMENVSYAHYDFTRTSPSTASAINLMLVTGFIKMTPQVANGKVKVRVYTSSSSARDGSPAEYVDLEIKSDDACIVAGDDGLSQWINFYLMADMTNFTGTYIHIELSCADYTNIDYYLDDLKVHEVKEVIEMEEPNKINLIWGRKTDAEYEMFDGSKKDYLRGWRPAYTLSYDYCSRAELIHQIGISESEFNYFAPHRDSINGDYVRMTTDLDSSYFQGRFLGHENSIALEGIFLRKFKNREYGNSYFTLTAYDTIS